ncbi:unnamed protein product [Cunninghamella echinulata]
MTGKGVVRSIKNYAKGFTDVQIKVREATSNNAWGPSGTLMNEIAQATYNQQDFIQVMDMIDRRLNDKGKNWRHVFKALLLLDYCVHVGSENVVLYAKENLYVVKTLKEFQHIDDNGRDVGSNVRQKAKDITSLLLDDARLKEERHKRTQMRDRMSAVGDYMNETILNGRHENGEQMYERPSYLDEDTELRKAIEESKRLAQEEAKKRNQGDEDLAKAIQLSEQEAREKEEKQRARLERENEQNLFNTNNNSSNNTQGFQGFPQNQAFSSSANPYTQQQQQFQQQQFQQQQWPQNTGMTGLSFSDPIAAQQPMFNQTTGFGNQFQQNNPYQQQQQAFPQSLQAQMTGIPQQTQFTGVPSFQTNQLMAQQPQMTGLPSFQTSTMTGTNPFGQQQQTQSLIPQQTQQFLSLQPQQTGFVTTSTPTISTATTTNGFGQTGSSAFGNNNNNSNNNNNNATDSSTNQLTTSSPANSKPEDPRYAKLNSLLGNREDGMDTFGNTGNLRIPFGSGYASTIKPETNATGNNITNTSNGNTANSSPSFSQAFSQQTSRNPFGAGNSSQSAPGTPVSNNKSLLEMMAEKNVQQQQQQQPFQQMQQPQMTGFNNNNGFGQQLQPQMTGFQQPQVTGFNQNSPFQQSQPQQQSSAFGQQNSSFF